MSELQISLLAIGFVVVAGVYGFNRFQESRYRRRAERAFPAARDDVLLKENTENSLPDAMLREESRIEPVVSLEDEPDTLEDDLPAATANSLVEEAVPEPAAVSEAPEQEQIEPAVLKQPGGVAPDDSIDYVVRVHPGDPVSSAAVLIETQRQDGLGKRVRWLGINPATGGWEEIGQGSAAQYRELAAAMQLADRAGPVSEQGLLAFCESVQLVAGELTAVPEFPDRQPALAQAAALDQFGADVDVLIGVNVISQNGEVFTATKVRALAEAAGMKLQADGTFHCFSDEGADLYSLGNLDPTPFSPDNIRQLSTNGITFLFDVPKVADGVRVFGQMLLVAKQMASTLGGVAVDDNRRPLSEAGIAKIKQQLADIYARMEEQGIKSGSDCALRLFS